METIKVEPEEALNKDNLSYEGSCFICLQEVITANQEQINLLNLFLKYLQIRDGIEAFVCEGCEENIKLFVKLSNTLEKVRLEMDYILEGIKEAILKSKAYDPVYSGLVSIREMVLKRGLGNMKVRSPKIILERLEPRERSPITISDETPSTPIIDKEVDLKSKINLEGSTKIHEAKKTEDGWEVKCGKCLKTFKNKNERHSKRALKRHDAAVHQLLKPFKCSTCPKSFSEQHKLQSHIDAVHLLLKPFKCTMCSKSFYEPNKLRCHVDAVHLGVKPYKCDICEKSFPTTTKLRLHKGTLHKPQNPTLFSCKICEKNFRTAKVLKTHQRFIHSIGKKFGVACDICNKSYKNNYNLKLHISSVHDKQRHFCQVDGCGKSYSFEQTLLNHYVLEHPESRFAPKPPKIPNDLGATAEFHSSIPKKTYSRIKKGESVVECKLCEIKYKSMDALEAHLETVHCTKEENSNLASSK